MENQVLAHVSDRLPLATGLRDALRGGYKPHDLRSDVLAGIMVGIVALPLSMALAIASGVPPQYGLYTAAVAGFIAALLGGSRVQVTGPTGAFVVILAPITLNYGLAGLTVATLIAGAILVTMGVAKLGRLIQFIPYPVVTGFTAGIAIVIATLQVKDFLGLTLDGRPEHYHEQVIMLARALPTIRPIELIIGSATLAILILQPRIVPKVPGPLLAMGLAAIAAFVLHRVGIDVVTIADRFGSSERPHGIPQALPHLGWPWQFKANGEPQFTWGLDTVRPLVLAGLTIAMLGAIESLLSAVVADGMSGHEHNPDGELIGQGIANLVAPFFGGFAATGAIARTSAGIRFGARSPIAAVVHSLFVLASLLVLAPLLGWLPMSAMAALLLRVAWNMSEAKHVIHTLRTAPRSDSAVLLTCLLLTVLMDMVIAVGVGIVLASLLFMQRMAAVGQVRLLDERHEALPEHAEGVMVYEVAGPMFFGAAQRAMGTLRVVRPDMRVVVLDMRAVPVMDLTGLVNLASAVDKLASHGIFVVLAGVQKQPLGVMARAHFRRDRHMVTVAGSFEEGLGIAASMAQLLILQEGAQPAA